MPSEDPKAPAVTPQKSSPAPHKSAADRLRVAHLDPNRPTPVHLSPDKPARDRIAERLHIVALPQLQLTGNLHAEGTEDWVFEGRLTANAVQECVVTLGPVKTTIDAPITRRWSPDQPEIDAEEMEMPADLPDPLDAFIDMREVAIEELSLQLPDFPRQPGAELTAASEEDDTPQEDPTRRPFAGLDKLLADRDS